MVGTTWTAPPVEQKFHVLVCCALLGEADSNGIKLKNNSTGFWFQNRTNNQVVFTLFPAVSTSYRMYVVKAYGTTWAIS